MKTKISYEWVIETLDAAGEIDDVNHADTFPGFPDSDTHIGLVRDERNTFDGDLENRSWAYIKDGKLPEYFTQPSPVEGQEIKVARVPAKFHHAVEMFARKVA